MLALHESFPGNAYQKENARTLFDFTSGQASAGHGNPNFTKNK